MFFFFAYFSYIEYAGMFSAFYHQFKVYESRYIGYLATSGSKRETYMRIMLTDSK